MAEWATKFPRASSCYISGVPPARHVRRGNMHLGYNGVPTGRETASEMGGSEGYTEGRNRPKRQVRVEGRQPGFGKGQKKALCLLTPRLFVFSIAQSEMRASTDKVGRTSHGAMHRTSEVPVGKARVPGRRRRTTYGGPRAELRRARGSF